MTPRLQQLTGLYAALLVLDDVLDDAKEKIAAFMKELENSMREEDGGQEAIDQIFDLYAAGQAKQ